MKKHDWRIVEAGQQPLQQNVSQNGSAVQTNQPQQPTAQKSKVVKSSFTFRGTQIDQAVQAVTQAAGQLEAGENVDDWIVLLTPVVDAANQILGGINSGVVDTIQLKVLGSPNVILVFKVQNMADAFVGKLNIYKDIKAYFKVTSSQELTKKTYRVTAVTNVKSIRTNYNGYKRVMNNLMTTKKKQTMNEQLLEPKSTLSFQQLKNLVNEKTGTRSFWKEYVPNVSGTVNAVADTAKTAQNQINNVGGATATQVNQIGRAATNTIGRVGNQVDRVGSAAVGTLKSADAQINQIGNATTNVLNTTNAQVARVGGDISQTARAAAQAAKSAGNTFDIVGRQVDQVMPVVSKSVGQIGDAGSRVDKTLKILTPVAAIATALFGAVQLSKLIKSIRGNKATSTIELDFKNGELANQFASSVTANKKLRSYCKINSIHDDRVVLDVDTKYLTNHYDEFNQTIKELMKTNKEETIGESALLTAVALGAASTLGSLVAAPIINAVQGKSGVQTTITYQFKNSNDMNKFVELMKDPKMVKASVKVVDENNVSKTVTIAADEKKVKKVFPNIEKYASITGAEGGSKITENTKITLTIGQIKRLVNETLTSVKPSHPDDGSDGGDMGHGKLTDLKECMHRCPDPAHCNDPRHSVRPGEHMMLEDDNACQETIDEIKRVINHYFEEDPWTGKSNNFYDPNLSAAELIDEIVEILS